MNQLKYHTRKNYEWLFEYLHRQIFGLPFGWLDLKTLSDESLIGLVNANLIRNNCTPLTEEELNTSLS